TGTYELHVTPGLTDFSGNPIVGSTPGGDFVFTFTVTGVTARSNAATTQLGNDTIGTAQDLGVIFGHEFEQPFTVSRDFSGGSVNPSDTADFYTFRVLQSADYSIFVDHV